MLYFYGNDMIATVSNVSRLLYREGSYAGECPADLKPPEANVAASNAFPQRAFDNKAV